MIDQKNWLFSQTGNGENASAILYSIIGTAKTNSLIPFDCLVKCLEELSQPEPDIESLLPCDLKNLCANLKTGTKPRKNGAFSF